MKCEMTDQELKAEEGRDFGGQYDMGPLPSVPGAYRAFLMVSILVLDALDLEASLGRPVVATSPVATAPAGVLI